MKKIVEHNDYIFNTRIYMKIAIDNEEQESVLQRAAEYLKEFERKLNFYSEDSEVSLINKNSGKQFVKVCEDTFNIIKSAKYYSQITNGLFDITIAPLVKRWCINSSSPKILSQNEIEEVKSLVNYQDILLDEENKKIMLAKENQKIDLGGIAKGYIADKIIEFYKANRIESGIINLGGNVKVLGRKNSEELWSIGIIEPKKHSNENIAALCIENLSIVTSGSYERAFKYNNELYHHILNPCTGYPAKSDLKSITVVSEESIKGDALSTPLFIMGKYKAYEFMKENKISGIMVTHDDKIIITKDLLEKFRLIKEYEVLAF